MKVGGEELLLRRKEEGTNCFFLACQQGNLDIAKTLIKAGGELLLLQTHTNGA